MSRPLYVDSPSDALGELSNFAPHGFEAEGAFWPTVEHWFQAQKFVGPGLAQHRERIRQARTPKEAKRLGQSRRHPLRSDWEDVKERVMVEALRRKFAKPVLRELLLSTERRPLVEASPTDAYWGSGPDGRGRNRLGHLLEQGREELRQTAAD